MNDDSEPAAGEGRSGSKKKDAGGAYLRPYQEALAAAGPGFDALLWRNRDFQETRFRVISEMANLRGKTVADFGCGQADMAEWLGRMDIPVAMYHGVDALPELVQRCKERAESERFAPSMFHLADFVADGEVFTRYVREFEVQVIMFSGSLNTLKQRAALRVLENAWKALERRPRREGATLVFNFLSTSAKSRGDTGPAKRFEPVDVVRWALHRSAKVAFRQDYLDGHDATIAMM